MTTFIVNGQQMELRYNVNGIDISADFIGNTSHGMSHDDDGNYIATQEDFEWWRATILAHEQMDVVIEAYKERFGSDEVAEVVESWSGGDLETDPAQVLMGLERNFGPLS